MIDFSEIRCVAFDLDDTLWPSEPTITNAEMELYVWLHEYYPRITCKYSLESLREHRVSLALRHPFLAHDVTALRKKSLIELAEKFDYPMRLANDGLRLFLQHRNKVEFFDDALSTLSKLREHFKIGAITNGNADLELIGVREHFDFVVTAQEAGVAKPNKEIFEFARKKVNLLSHELLFVGDHPTVDVLGAKNSGWKVLWFNPFAAEWLDEIKPDAQIQKLSELPNLLKI